MIHKPSLNVLLVEDNPDHAALAKNAITKAKSQAYAVEVASSAENAMEKLLVNTYHMVISDFNLGGKTGLDLLNWLNSKKKELPFIMMTGMGDEKTAVDAMQNGAYNYIVKDDVYLSALPHVVDETFIKHLADKEKERYELEIRDKNVQLEKANRELKKLDQLKSDFIASVSHDIRSPLNSIRESISLILEGIVDIGQEKGQQVLHISKRSTDRLGKMIDDLLDFSKLENGKIRLHVEPVDIQVLIDEAVGTLKSLAVRKKVALKFKPNKQFPKVPCDGERFLQVLINLIGNSIKFTREGGSITLNAEVRDDRAVITVSDTGIGIKKEHLASVFGRFEQIKGADSGGIKGTGLGLAICKELIGLHDGKIWVESEFGKGSCFFISLPLTQQSSNNTTPETKDEGGS